MQSFSPWAGWKQQILAMLCRYRNGRSTGANAAIYAKQVRAGHLGIGRNRRPSFGDLRCAQGQSENDGEGVVTEMAVPEAPLLGLIAKKDYYNSVPNFVPITDHVMG